MKLMAITILEREMTEAEYTRELEGFREHAIEYGIPDIPGTRHGFVANEHNCRLQFASLCWPISVCATPSAGSCSTATLLRVGWRARHAYR